MEDLLAKGVPCEKISILKKRKADPVPDSNPIYMVSLKKEVDLKSVWAIKYVCRIKVKWEKYKNSRKVTQCHNCQNFGHGTMFCKNKARCVKCDKGHLTKKCNKKIEEPPKCTNYGGEHPANYSKCPVYLKHLGKIEAKRNNNLQPQLLRRMDNKHQQQHPQVMNQREFPPLRAGHQSTPVQSQTQHHKSAWTMPTKQRTNEETIFDDYQSLMSENNWHQTK